MTRTAWGVGSLATKKMLERGQHRPSHWPRGTMGAPRPRPPAIPAELSWEADDIRSAPGSHPPQGDRRDYLYGGNAALSPSSSKLPSAFPASPALRPGCCCLY